MSTKRLVHRSCYAVIAVAYVFFGGIGQSTAEVIDGYSATGGGFNITA